MLATNNGSKDAVHALLQDEANIEKEYLVNNACARDMLLLWYVSAIHACSMLLITGYTGLIHNGYYTFQTENTDNACPLHVNLSLNNIIM